MEQVRTRYLVRAATVLIGWSKWGNIRLAVERDLGMGRAGRTGLLFPWCFRQACEPPSPG